MPQMSRSGRRILLPGLVAFALMAGPVAVCADCCPRGERPPSIVAAPACCGHCSPLLERSSDQVTIAAKKAIAGPHTIGAVSEPPTHTVRAPDFPLETATLRSLPASLSAVRAQLRL